MSTDKAAPKDRAAPAGFPAKPDVTAPVGFPAKPDATVPTGPAAKAPAGAAAGSGAPAPAGSAAGSDAAPPTITFEQVCETIRPLKDPEIGISIVELGLLYGHEYDPQTRRLKVKMTLTSQMCPAGPELVGGVKFMAGRMENVDDVEVELVWNPPWDPKTHCSEDAKAILGIWE